MPKCSRLSAIFWVLCLATMARGHEFTYSALLSGTAVSPPNGSAGTGIAVVTLDLDLVTMRVEVTFGNLTGTVTSSHVHGVTAVAGAGNAIAATELPTLPGFPLGVTSGVYDQTIDLTVASSYNPAFIAASGGTVSDALNAVIFGMADGKMYLDIETTAFPEGEIRGFLTAVPEPGTVMLLGSVAAGAGVVAWRRRTKVSGRYARGG